MDFFQYFNYGEIVIMILLHSQLTVILEQLSVFICSQSPFFILHQCVLQRFCLCKMYVRQAMVVIRLYGDIFPNHSPNGYSQHIGAAKITDRLQTFVSLIICMEVGFKFRRNLLPMWILTYASIGSSNGLMPTRSRWVAWRFSANCFIPCYFVSWNL